MSYSNISVCAPMSEWTKQQIDDYVEKRQAPGGFLTAVLENNLKKAVERADLSNLPAIPNIVCYLYNECPSTCWGGKEAVDAWLKEEACVDS